MPPDLLIGDMTTILDALQKGTGYLEKHGVDSARLNMQELLAKVVGCERMQLYVDFDRPLEEEKLVRLRKMMKDRTTGVPLQHIIGDVEFFGQTFISDERALIPRPETEHLVDHLAKLPWPNEAKILDVGCGTGVIGLSLAIALRDQQPNVTLADLSPEALALSKENADQLAEALEGSDVSWLESDLFSQVSGQFHLITANLPYLSESDMQAITREVQHDPALALLGGTAGTELMDQFLHAVTPHLEPNGMIAMEFGAGQEGHLEALAGSVGLKNVQILKDLEGRDRFLLAQKL